MQASLPPTEKRVYGPKLFIGRIGPTTTPTSLRRHFEQFCTVQVVKIEFSRKSKFPKGFGYVIVESEDDVAKVLACSHVLDGKTVNVMRYEYEVTSTWYENKEKSIKIKVKNITPDVSIESIYRFFENYGQILVAGIVEESLGYGRETILCALVEIMNNRVDIKIGENIVKHSIADYQSLNYRGISRLFAKIVAVHSKSYNTSENIITPISSSNPEAMSYSFGKLDFNDSSEGKHSKYVFNIQGGGKEPESHINYRFNISLLARRPAQFDSRTQVLERDPIDNRHTSTGSWHWLC